MKLSVQKTLDEIKFLTKLSADGSGSVILNLPNIKQFERPLTDAEVAHCHYLLYSVSGGTMTFGDSEPGDVLGEAVSNTGLVEDQAAMILSLTEERDTAARAAANANQRYEETSGELEAVRARLREVTQSALDETSGLRTELDTVLEREKIANAQIDSLRGELTGAGEEASKLSNQLATAAEENAAMVAKLAKAEADLLEAQTKPDSQRTNPDASPKPPAVATSTT